jgi:murein DD-endopeptidase MepM/ murein hydrolase activator NlpD
VLPWGWIAALDQGIRDDSYGLGHFQAPRQGYKHSGIDFLMPVGTTLLSPCAGSYLAGYDGGYGNWVQVICKVPPSIAGDQAIFASMLYAHLNSTAVPITGIDPNKAGKVSQGQKLGTAGKSGNAGAAGIHAHLHFEVALHSSELAGLQEAHISGSDGDNAAATALRASIKAACLEPTGFAPTKATLNIGRRIDPFIFLTCLSGEKPPLMTPEIQALHAWSADYTAETFDVDVGMP